MKSKILYTSRLLAGAMLVTTVLTGVTYAQDATPNAGPIPASPGAAPDTTPTPPDTTTQAPPEKQRPTIGPEISLFLPSSSKTKDTFGKSWFGFGLGAGSVHQAGLLGHTSGEFFFLTKSGGGNKAYLLPIGVSYRRDLVKEPSTKPTPYIGVSGDVIPNYIKVEEETDGEEITREGVDGKIRVGAGASVILGTTFGPKGYVEARYIVTTKVTGYNFSGLNISLGIRF